MKIGLPKSLYFYKFEILLKEFFKIFNISIITSDICEINHIEGMCLPMNKYIENIKKLISEVDYILVFKTIDNNLKECPNIELSYQLITNITEKDTKIKLITSLNPKNKNIITLTPIYIK